ncbi:MAG: PAS domain S-box protein, partial [Candidatus Aminicenantales bacterium]
MKNQKTEKKGDKVIRKYEEFTRDILETIREPLLVLNADLRVVSANRAFYRTFATKPEETEGMSIYELGNRQWDIPELRKLLEEILPGNTSFDDFEVTHDFQSVGRKTMLLNARRIYDGRGKTQMVLLAMEDVTERHQARASLTASEEKYRDLVEKAGIAILIDDKEGNFQYVNKRFAEMFGYSVEEMKRQSIQSLVHPEDVERVMKLHKERIEGRKSESKYEFRGVRKDGSVIFLEVDAVALEEGNRIVGTRSYIWDITERKEAEQALKEGEAKYRAIVEQSHDEIFIYRGDKFLYVNDRLCETSGYTKDELYQMEIWDLIHPEDRERVKKIGQDRAKGKNVPSRYFARGLTKTGEIRHCEFSVNVISYRGEYAVLGTVRDITDRVNFEKALEESERKYRTLTENINDIVYSSDSKGIITYISPQVKRFGFKPEEIVSRKFRDFTEFIAPEDREELRNNFQRTMRTGKEFVTEFRIVDKKEQVHWMEDFGRVQRDESGKIVGLIGILRDISERKRAEREIQKSNRKLYKALEDTVHALASAVEKRDPSTAGHQKHVALLACAIAEEMGLPEDRIKGIRMA